MKYLISVVLVGSLALGAMAQAPATPKLKESVELTLAKLQRDYAVAAATEQSLINQYNETSTKKNDLATKLRQGLDSALKESGIDESKYDIDPSTLEIKPKPVQPPAAKPAAK